MAETAETSATTNGGQTSASSENQAMADALKEDGNRLFAGMLQVHVWECTCAHCPDCVASRRIAFGVDMWAFSGSMRRIPVVAHLFNHQRHVAARRVGVADVAVPVRQEAAAPAGRRGRSVDDAQPPISHTCLFLSILLLLFLQRASTHLQ